MYCVFAKLGYFVTPPPSQCGRHKWKPPNDTWSEGRITQSFRRRRVLCRQRQHAIWPCERLLNVQTLLDLFYPRGEVARPSARYRHHFWMQKIACLPRCSITSRLLSNCFVSQLLRLLGSVLQGSKWTTSNTMRAMAL